MNSNILKNLRKERRGISRLTVRRRVKPKSTFIDHNIWHYPNIVVKSADLTDAKVGIQTIIKKCLNH